MHCSDDIMFIIGLKTKALSVDEIQIRHSEIGASDASKVARTVHSAVRVAENIQFKVEEGELYVTIIAD